MSRSTDTTCHGAGPVLAKDQIVIDLVNEPSTLDPQLQWNPDSYNVYRNIFDNLVTRDNDETIIPQLALSWRNVSDTRVEFTLRQDIRFQDGSKLTPDDVVFSIHRITDPKFKSPQLGQVDRIVSAEVTAPDKLTVTTSGVYPVLLAQLVKLSILPRHVVEQVGDTAFNQDPVGSAPYAFASWQHGVSVELQRNLEYWGTRGAFESALFRQVPEVSTRVADLQSGRADLAVTLDNDTAQTIAHSAQFEARTALTERVAYFGLNVQTRPLNDVRIGDRLCDRQSGHHRRHPCGRERQLDQLVSPASTGWVDGIKGLPYNPNKQRR